MSKAAHAKKSAGKGAKVKKPAPAKKPTGKKPAPKSAPKPTSKPVSKPGAKPAAKSPLKPATKPTPAKPAPAPVASSADKHKPKGITVVDKDKPQPPSAVRRPTKPKKEIVMPNLGAPLLGPGSKWKPLIQSGPKAPKVHQLDVDAARQAHANTPSPFPKKELERYKQILLRKRAELTGDVRSMESQALQDAGNLSHVPQHVAEQGSEAYDQSLALDIAEVDRKLIREIDDAIRRIDNGTYGICEITGKPINKERLEELPWTRHSIEAAREVERRTYVRTGSQS